MNVHGKSKRANRFGSGQLLDRQDKILCECGQTATRKVNSAWQCERCIAIVPDDYHGLKAGIRPTKITEVSANRLLMEWKEQNA